ncbi:YfiH family protein; multi-copper polyphenol oxidoreductase laccase [Thioalkalivibrio nitratireducens DSM 14787]|uniref:Purine nucleoside phosphorylase n=1 Tax=Thioalkalivibrio nitratireducens (strain DSM 14787 / UNIQEM 213 / ALEN2) TaxID=1255043 RepID=L0DYT4_THIND|nr:peptidoglycan editing factor PgeF [Thioalkalivibrio nitratireducens]AGA34125.1 YfiH family protein; multi-copper polyphenol oxidoreductase laccase [Thioalkalivibrio nitratireducens DSM 14787]
MTTIPLIIPDWPLSPNLRAAQTTRAGGVSAGRWSALNLAGHTGDAPEAVAANRRLLADALGLPVPPVWPRQVHGAAVADASDVRDGATEADAVVAGWAGQVCSVQTADCLPVLFASLDGRTVAAAHAGWRGLAAGVLEATLQAMGHPPGDVTAWLGPAIGPDAFEVGPEVRAAFLAGDPGAEAAFRSGTGDRWFADIYRLARLRLQHAGIREIHGGGRCTFAESDTFFSYRRDGVCGRMATLIWRVS